MSRPEVGRGSGANELKACCAAAYESDAVALLLGRDYHPGGTGLTRRLVGALELRPGQRVLDVASGRGGTAVLLAREFGARVDGVDLGEGSLAAAEQAANEAGLAESLRFTNGDAEELPFEDGTFDAVVCECAFCTFPAKARAAEEFARVLAPAGRLGLADVCVTPEALGGQLRTLAGWMGCLAGARTAAEYTGLLAGAGLATARRERHDGALARMIDEIEARLGLLRMLGSPELASVDLDRVRELTGLARQAVDDGSAGYVLLVASKPV